MSDEQAERNAAYWLGETYRLAEEIATLRGQVEECAKTAGLLKTENAALRGQVEAAQRIAKSAEATYSGEALWLAEGILDALSTPTPERQTVAVPVEVARSVMPLLLGLISDFHSDLQYTESEKHQNQQVEAIADLEALAAALREKGEERGEG